MLRRQQKRPQFWDLDFKFAPNFNHVAKFHADQPRKLGDLVLKKTSVVRRDCLSYVLRQDRHESQAAR